MKTIGVVTVGRSDYGIYLPILRRIRAEPSLGLLLFAGGMHLSSEFGSTLSVIEADGFEINQLAATGTSSNTPEGVVESIGRGVISFGKAYSRQRPDILLVLGDRFEMYAAVVAALPLRIPVAHIHGGELSEGAIDDALRHSITKLSHLHFVSTELYARRVIQLGEEPWRVVVSGAPALDNLNSLELLTREQLAQRYGLKTDQHFLLVTYHPVTLEYELVDQQIAGLLTALDELDMAVVFTYPNADPGSRKIIDAVRDYAARNDGAYVFVNMGTQGYFSLMKHADAMVGNSSSGIIEAASFKLPVVNVGNRQCGRLRARNVIDVGNSPAEIVAGIKQAIDSAFRDELRDLVNPYGDGRATDRIVDTLRAVEVNDKLLRKHFYEM